MSFMQDLKRQLTDLRDSNVQATSMDVLHQENVKQGRDKYKTLKQIRSGNTKQRVDQFEMLWARLGAINNFIYLQCEVSNKIKSKVNKSTLTSLIRFISSSWLISKKKRKKNGVQFDGKSFNFSIFFCVSSPFFRFFFVLMK